MATLRRREFLAQAAAAPAAQRTTAKRPRNILLLIADDLGLFIPSYGDPNAAGEGVLSGLDRPIFPHFCAGAK